MSGKYQIVPELASAVHGVIEELPFLPDCSSVELNRSRSTSSTSSSNNFHILSSNSRIISQVDVRKAFTYFDKNRDGKLSIKEFQSVMHDLGYKAVDKRFIRQMFAEAKRNGNRHTLSYDEFVEFLQSKLASAAGATTTTTTNQSQLTNDLNSLSSPKMQLDIETLFNCYDLDKNGFIEPKELRKVMKRLTGEKLSKQDINEMINAADRNGDGLLDKKEFALLCSAF